MKKLAWHCTLRPIIRKVWRDFDGSHVVFCLEGRSWRKDHYVPTKETDPMQEQ